MHLHQLGIVNGPVTNSNSLGTGAVTVNNGGELDFGNGLTINNPITIAGFGVPFAGTGGAIGHPTSGSATTIRGPVILSGDAGLSNTVSTGTINTNGFQLTILGGVTASGAITGTGSVVSASKAFLTVTAASTYSGGTTILGALAANSTTGSSTGTGPVQVMPGGMLFGSGTISGPVSTLSVGVGRFSNGTLDTFLGATRFGGGLALADHTQINIRNLAPSLAVTGNLTLAQGVLVNIEDVTLAPGTYKLFTYTGSLAGGVTGWSVGQVNDMPYNATYAFSTATPGEVDLIIGSGVSSRPTLKGAFGNANWTNPANWETGVAPVPGNLIVFDTQTPFGSYKNDFPTNTQFNGIRFDNNINTVAASGNPINLGGDIISDFGTASTTELDMNLALLQNANVVGGILLTGVISGPYTVTIASGAAKLTGANTFSGGLTVVNCRIRFWRPRRASAGLRPVDSQEPGFRVSVRRHSLAHPALSHAPAKPAVHGGHQGQETRGAGGIQESAGDGRATDRHPPAAHHAEIKTPSSAAVQLNCSPPGKFVSSIQRCRLDEYAREPIFSEGPWACSNSISCISCRNHRGKERCGRSLRGLRSVQSRIHNRYD